VPELSLDAAFQQHSLDQALSAPQQDLQGVDAVEVFVADPVDFCQSSLSKGLLNDVAIADDVAWL
jgi:hypothetical protein